MSTSSQNDGRSDHEALTDRVYDSIVEFNKVAHWDILRLAQMRWYLAEHLTKDLLAFYRADIAGAELRAAAEEIASPVPPLEAGPRTEFERGLVTAFHALRRRADKLDGGAS